MSLEAGGWRLPSRVAYVVSHSRPHAANGYAQRTHAVARALWALGHDVVVVNRPGRPWDIADFAPDGPVACEERVDGVRYVFLPLAPDRGQGPFRRAEAALREAFAVLRPAAVLAASSWETAEPALGAARALGIPFLYEQRGFWEMTRADAEPGFAGSAEHARHVAGETRVARAALAVFTLTEAMRGEVIRRGAAPGAVELVPNGVTVPGQATPPADRAALGIAAARVLAYMGSLAPYEGVEDLVRLVALMRGEGEDVAALIVGSGVPQGLVGSRAPDPAQGALARLAAEMGVDAHVHLVAQVPPERVGAFYALADAVVLPRRAGAATALVAPLKPYEAAGHGVPVFMPARPPLDDVAAEIGGTLYPDGDLPALAALLRRSFSAGRTVRKPPPALLWTARVRPLSAALSRIAAAEAARLRAALGTLAAPEAAASAATAPGASFDASRLPEVALPHLPWPGIGVVAGIGPCRGHAGPGFTALTRANVLGRLAAGAPGLFVIDWAGLREEPGEWVGLWGAHDLRLSRLVMDAARIARDRGWTMRVLGPVARAEAPLFRTVTGLFEEVVPEALEAAP